jgi:hypothetical protein
LRYGFAAFVEELAGAVNRINYNQCNQGMNALAGLVSYLPAAQPEVRWFFFYFNETLSMQACDGKGCV